MADELQNTPIENEPVAAQKTPTLEDYFAYNPVDKNEFAQAQTIRFGAEDLGRYLTYGSRVFGELGYNPTLPSIEEVYLQNTTASDDYRRAWAGHKELMKIGFKDTFGFGMSKDEDNASQFHEVMSNYAPTQGRDEWTSFWSNTILSAGYTTGIIGAIATEELLYAGATALTGGMGAAAGAVEQGQLWGRAMYNLNRGARMLDASLKRNKVFGSLYRMRTINNSRILRGTGEMIHGLGKNLRPFGNTMDFIRDAHKLGDMNKVQQVMTGAGAMARDARMFYVTHSEALLESDFTKHEVMDIYLKEWYKKHPGQKMSNDIYQDIIHRADKAGEMTYRNNLLAIYMTNAMTFNGLFKGFSPTNGWFGRYKGGFRVKGKGLKRQVLAVENNLAENLRRKAAGITWASAGKKGIEMSMEGVQEVSQDIISAAAKKYAGIKTVPGFGGPEYILPDDLGSSKRSDYVIGDALHELADSYDASSWHTFGLGAAIGIFAGPVNIATQVISDYSVGSQNYIWSKSGREKTEAAYLEREKKAQFLTEVFNKSGAGAYFEETGKGVHEQINAMEKLIEAAERGDKKYFEDKKGEVFRNGIGEIFKYGLEKEYISYLKDLHNYTPQELNENFDRTDITAENKEEFTELANQYVDRIEKMAKRYKELEDDPRFTTLDDFTTYEPESQEAKDQAYRRYAISQLKKEMLFSGDIIEERFNRLKSLKKKLTANGYMTESDLLLLYNKTDIAAEVQALSESLKADQEYNMDNTPEYSKKKARLEALEQQLTLLKKAEGLASQEGITEDDVLELQDEMREVFKQFVNSTPKDEVRNIDEFYSQPGSTQVDEEKFGMFWDYMALADDLTYYQRYVETLNDPNAITEKVEALEKIFKDIDENKKQHILNSLRVADEKKTAEKIIKRFLDMGMVFDLNEIDDLVMNGIMPSKIYNVETHEEVTDEQYRDAVKIAKRYYKDLSGKTLVGVKKGLQLRKQRHALDVRNARELLKEFSGYNAFDKPYNITVLVKRLLKSRFRVNTDLLEKLQELKLLDGKVMLTESGTKPIEIQDDGTLVIDVRFSSQDYVSDLLSKKAQENIIKETLESIARNNPNITPEEVEDYRQRIVEELEKEKTPTVSFEYLALTAVLTNIYAQKVKTNKKFRNAIGVLMDMARKAHVASTPKEEINNVLSLPYYYDPILFITEALNNTDLQSTLASIEYNDGTEDTSLWEDLQNRLVKQGVIADEGDLSNTLLEEILNVAQTGLTETEIDVVNEEGAKEDEVEEEVEEEVTEEEVEEEVSAEEEVIVEEEEELSETEKQKRDLDNQIKDLDNQIDELEEERGKKPKDIKGKALDLIRRKWSRLTNQMIALKNQRKKLVEQRKALDAKAAEIDVRVDSTKDNLKTQDSPTKPKTDSAGNKRVSVKDKFDALPREVQLGLTRVYFINNWKLFFDPSEHDYDAIMRAAYNDELDFEDILDNLLSEDDIDAINESLQDPDYAKVIIDFNLKGKTEEADTSTGPVAPVKEEEAEVEEEEEVEEEDDDSSSDPNEEENRANALDIDVWDASKIRTLMFELEDPEMMKMYSDEELEEYIEKLNAAETVEEREAILEPLQEMVNQDYQDLQARRKALNKTEVDLEGLEKVPEEHTRISGINVEAYSEPRSKVQEGEVLTVKVQEGPGLFKSESRPEGYDYVIRIFNKDGEVIGSVGYETAGAKAIMASSKPNESLIQISTINEKDGKILFENVGVYVTDIKADEPGAKVQELRDVLAKYQWNHRVDGTLNEANEKAQVEHEKRIIELVNELGAEGQAIYKEVFQEQLDNQVGPKAEAEFAEMFDILKGDTSRDTGNEILAKIKDAEWSLFRLESERRNASYGSTEPGHPKSVRDGYAKEVARLDKEIAKVEEEVEVLKRQFRQRDLSFEELLRQKRAEEEAAKTSRQRVADRVLTAIEEKANSNQRNIVVNTILNEVKRADIKMSELIAIYDIMNQVTRYNFTPKQIAAVTNIIQERFQRNLFDPQALYTGAVVKIKPGKKHSGLFKLKASVPNQAFKVFGTTVKTNKLFSFDVFDFINDVEEVLEEGISYSEKEVKITINEEDASSIQASYTEIFDNFTKEVEASEFTDLSDQELEQEIIKELKCK